MVAISILYGNIADRPITGHRAARTTSFFAEGNQVSEISLPSAIKKDVWYTATAIEVQAETSSYALVTMGDSITDGYGTKYNYFTRWTDYLAQRLVNNSESEHIAIANVGIGGAGSSMSIEHFKRDVLDIKGAEAVLIFIGINDIVYGDNSSASALIDNYKKMASIAHDNGLKVIGATITPMGSHSENAKKEIVRQHVNSWIRSTAIAEGIYDGFVDFDLAVRDPSQPTYLLPEYAVDDLHLNIVGYQAMSEAIDVNVFY